MLVFKGFSWIDDAARSKGLLRPQSPLRERLLVAAKAHSSFAALELF
jgi:hypothetical protein